MKRRETRTQRTTVIHEPFLINRADLVYPLLLFYSYYMIRWMRWCSIIIIVIIRGYYYYYRVRRMRWINLKQFKTASKQPWPNWYKQVMVGSALRLTDHFEASRFRWTGITIILLGNMSPLACRFWHHRLPRPHHRLFKRQTIFELSVPKESGHIEQEIRT